MHIKPIGDKHFVRIPAEQFHSTFSIKLKDKNKGELTQKQIRTKYLK